MVLKIVLKCHGPTAEIVGRKTLIASYLTSHMNCVCIMSMKFLSSLAFSSISVSGILSCHLIPKILLRQTVKVIQLASMPSINCSWLTSRDQCCFDSCSV